MKMTEVDRKKRYKRSSLVPLRADSYVKGGRNGELREGVKRGLFLILSLFLLHSLQRNLALNASHL